MIETFEWQRILLNDLPTSFLWEVMFRSIVMFVFLLLAMKVAGKRGVKQLSVFETVIIIALGSAAGDPMLYDDVSLLPALTVIFIIILFYKVITWLTAIFPKFEQFMEGKTECIIDEGEFSIKSFKKERLAQDEFFSELRAKSIEHLGQIKYAFVETNGDISTFYYPDEEVKYGLPILPQLFNQKSTILPKIGIYACAFCGKTEKQHATTAKCTNCGKEEWVVAIKTKRIS